MTRLAAAAAFLLAFTVLALLVRSSLQAENASVTPTTTAPAATAEQPAEDPVETEPPGTIATPTATAPTEPPADAEFYEVQAGDTLAAIADAHETTVEELVALNPGVDPVQLSIGQRLRVR